ncbi:MAG: DUF4190 domain-containing protein [Anaerolineales bacterium]|nr:DUF4190 domain-containing protein [Anaerolineales bacterium]
MAEPSEERSYLPPEEPPFQISGLATASLFLGLASWIILPVLGAIPAIVLGHMARVRIAQSEGRLTGDGLAAAGLVMGYANIVLIALITVCIAGLFLLPVAEKLLSP